MDRACSACSILRASDGLWFRYRQRQERICRIGCRNNWHVHTAKKGGGQILICTAGEGWYQEWGQPARRLKPGDVVNIPTGVKHWHGATKDSWFQHIAIAVPGEECGNEWLEPVSDEDYSKLD